MNATKRATRSLHPNLDRQGCPTPPPCCSHAVWRQRSTASCERSLSTLLSAACRRRLLNQIVAQDIPPFGLRRKLEKIEEEANEVVKEGEKEMEGSIGVAEKEVKAVKKEIESAEEGLLLGGKLVQATAAKAFRVIMGVFVVNGILKFGKEKKRGFLGLFMHVALKVAFYS